MSSTGCLSSNQEDTNCGNKGSETPPKDELSFYIYYYSFFVISWVGASRSTQINALFFFQASEGLSCCKEASRDERRAAVHIGVAHGVAERWHLAVTQKRSAEKPKTVSTVAGQKPDASSNKTTPSNADDSTTDDPEPHRVGGKFETPNKEPSLTVTEVRVVVVGDQSNPEDNSPTAKSPCPSIADNSKESPVNGKDVGSWTCDNPRCRSADCG